MRLVAVIAAVAIPLAMAMLFLWWTALQDGRARQLRLLEIQVAQVERDLRKLWSDAAWFMPRMASRPPFRHLRPEACADEIVAGRDINRAFLGITLWSPDGGLVCSTFLIRAGQPAPAPYRKAFEDGMAADGLHLSGIFTGPITGLQISTFTFPVKDDAGVKAGLLSIPVRSEFLERLLLDLDRLPGSAAGIADREFRLVARVPAMPDVVGKSVAALSGLAAGLESGAGSFEATGVDGVKRIIAHKVVPDSGWHVYVGVEDEVLYSGFRRQLVQGISAFAAVVAFSLGLAYLLSRSISRPLRQLVSVADAVAKGDRSARSAATEGGEIALLADHVNRMLDSVEDSEAALRISEARLRAIIETEPECVTVMGADGYVREKNAAGLAVLDADSLDQLRKMPLIELVVPEYRKSFEDLFRRVMGGESGVLEYELETLKGRRRWLQTHAAPLRDTSGNVTDMLGITLDVTERRRMEGDLRESEERLRLATEGARIGTWDWDIPSNRVRWDPVLLDIFGLDASQFETEIEVWFRQVHAQDRERLRGAIRNALKERARYSDEFRIVRSGGETRWIAAEGKGIGAPPERATRMIGIARDITERKRMEDELRASEDRYRSLAESSPDAILIHQDYRIVYVNPAMVQLVRAPSAAALQGKSSVSLLAPEHAESSRARSELLYAGESVPRVERVYIRLDGTRIEVEIAAAPMLFDGKPAAQVTVRDIEARRRTENALRESEGRYRALAESSPDSILIHQDLHIVFVNDAMVKLLRARSAADLVGKSSLFMVRPEQVEAARRRTGLLYAGEPQPIVEQVYLRLDGTPVDVEIAAAPLTFNGKPAAQVTVRDITARKQAERMLRASMLRARELSARLLVAEEGERKRIAHDLHDQLGQELTALKIRLETIARSAVSPGTRTEVLEVAAAAGEALQRVRQMSVDLRPPQLDSLGLSVALRAHAQRLSSLGKVNVHYDSRGFQGKVPAEIEIMCFRVAQEALTNVMRHSGASNAWIDLAVVEGVLRLSVRDDGVGFDAAQALDRTEAGGGFGLLGMQERVALAGGTLDIRSEPAQGCTVNATFPLSGSGA